jgi:hypothetical protein
LIEETEGGGGIDISEKYVRFKPLNGEEEQEREEDLLNS